MVKRGRTNHAAPPRVIPEQAVYGSRDLEPLLGEVVAANLADPAWVDARRALLNALQTAEDLGAKACPGRFGRRNWLERLA